MTRQQRQRKCEVTTARYFVKTWDTDKQQFTPQKGVRCGPYTLWGLKRALRKLQELGYDTTRRRGFSVLVSSDRRPSK